MGGGREAGRGGGGGGRGGDRRTRGGGGPAGPAGQAARVPVPKRSTSTCQSSSRSHRSHRSRPSTLQSPSTTPTHPPTHPGGSYLDWLATSRAALELGVEGFIERDADSLFELVGRAAADSDIRNLLSGVGLVELLAPHHGR